MKHWAVNIRVSVVNRKVMRLNIRVAPVNIKVAQANMSVGGSNMNTDASSISTPPASTHRVHHCGVKWCICSSVRRITMRPQAKRNDSGAHERTVRASISFPEEQYQALERIAAENKVSLAWVVRDAIDGYLKSKRPLIPHGTDAEDVQQRSQRA
ncbi:CopG family transcriptional regulator [Zoogloea sp. 1C4]|uniref:ribbon-helix-helix domain-containing protein n=1 Tax=Zoogloea sp. 1C4 TaxID=2570190 RepID=UPI001D1752B5|nr:CopG family transcriptional regulator [Zoogloea sp. 1C4]